MKGTIKGLVAIVALAGAAACSDAMPTESSFAEAPGAAALARTNSTLTFSSTQSYESETPQTATGGVGGIDFTGNLWTGNPCVTVTASHSERTGSVTVTVTAAPNGSGGCIQVITNNNYTGRVSGLAPGAYTFTVVHDRAGTRETAFAGTVVVS